MKYPGGGLFWLTLFALLGATPAFGLVLTDSLSPPNDLLLPFGLRTVGTALNQVVIVTNESNGPLTLGSIGVDNPLDPPYLLDSAACAGRILAPMEVCTLNVGFAPTAVGGFTDTFDISSDDPATPQILFSVSGSGAPIPVADILVSDSLAPFDDLSLPFGERMVGTSFTQSLLVANEGNAPLVLGAIGADPALPQPFSIGSDHCSNRTLAPNESCALAIAFSPAAVGTFTASISIPSNDPDEQPLTFNLSGVATPVPVPDIELSLPAGAAGGLHLDFGDGILGNSQAQTLLIANAGTAPLLIGAIGGELPPGGPFRLPLDGCSSQTLAPGQDCVLTLAFAPTAVGAQSATLAIPSNDPEENPLLLVLSGNGLAPEVNHPPSAPGLVFPSDGQAQVATTVALVWTPSVDPDGQALIYKVYWSTTPTFADSQPLILTANAAAAGAEGALNPALLLGLVLPWLPGGRWRRGAVLLTVLAGVLLGACGGFDPGESGGSAVQHLNAEISGLSPATVYYWKVIADDGQPGGVVESATYSFRTR